MGGFFDLPTQEERGRVGEGVSVPWQTHRPCAKRPNRNGSNPRRRSTRRSHPVTSRDRKAGLADRGLDTRTAGLDRLEDWLNFFDFGEAALVDGGSVVDSSAAWLEVAPDEERYSSRTQPCSWVIGSDTRNQLPSRLITCKFVPGE